MDRRYGVAVAFALLAFAAAGILTLYTPATTTASSPAEPGELDGSFAVSESITFDGSHFFSRETIVTDESGEQRLHLSFEDITYDHYWTDSGHQYTKITADTEAHLEEQLKELDVHEEVLYAYDDEPSVIVESMDDGNATGPADLSFPDTLTHSQLEMTAFEQTETIEGTTLTKYESQTGWTEVDGSADDQTVYVADADGEIHIDESEQLQYATITLERVDAGTWGGYLLEREEAWTTSYEYEISESVEEATIRPEWVDHVR